MNTIMRPSLGQSVQLGTLYDARTESFLDSSLLRIPSPSPSPSPSAETETEPKPFPTSFITSTPQPKTSTTIVKTTSIAERFQALNVSPDLGASLLAGLVLPRGGASQYLAHQGDTVPAVHRAVVYTVEDRAEQLSFMSGDVREVLNFKALEGSQATHVVTGVVYGARSVVSAQRRVMPGEERGDVEGIVVEAVKGFVSEGEGYKWLDLPENHHQQQQQQQHPAKVDDMLRVRTYTDAREIFNGQTDSIADAAEHFGHLQGHVQRTGGVPLMYTLLPVTYLSMLGAVLPDNVVSGQLSKECYDQVVGLVDHLASLQRTLNAHHHQLVQHRGLVTQSHFARVKEEARKAIKAEEQFRAAYTAALPIVRDGIVTSQAVLDIVNQAKSDILGPNELNDLTSTYDKKLEFLSRMVKMGAIFPEDAKSKAQEVIDRTGISYHSFYVFHFSDAAVDTSSELWKENQQLLEDFLTQHPKPHVLLIDWDTQRPDLTQPYIAEHANGSIVVENLLDQRKDLAEKHLVKYDRAYLEATTDVPSYRKSLRIPCPGPHCDEQNLCLWSCADCHETVEFGSRDGFFYCDCGRVPFHKSSFNCQGPYHRDKENGRSKSMSDFYQFDRATLRDLLLSLPEPREVNILILGETGVGKSTFVNAFVNYLTFNSLDDGLKDPRLNCIIPCSFTTQVVDGETGRMISRDVVVGKDKDEADGSKGSSATQKATVYPLYFKDTLIRLIDTPGIGDTRGLDQDKQNMANMLSILRNYPSLHGILILLKPNNARLGVMFRFCVKELLTHLHTSAAQNMVFGFTNTRGSNYTPGDTFKPLESLLSSYQDVIPQLSRDNVYCFDSESFRYLAARKQGIEMGHEDDYRRSWEHSAAEGDRLLAHFQSLRPHHTQETLSLNETRHLIAQLTAPMQQISVAISDTIVKNVKQVAELRDAEGTMTGLQGKLEIHKTNVSAQQLDKPKTVCANPKCVETVFDEAKNEKVLLRKKLCHNPCCLTNVPVGQVGTPQLQNCFAFNGEYCSVCSHRWDEHEHILVEYAKSEETVIDANVQRELNTTGSLVKAKKSAIAAIERNIAELKTEHAAVQNAAARFSLYLKNNSITHYNDATVEYLEHLIKDERTKVRTGDSRQRLEALEKDLDNYKKFVDAMEQKDKSSSSTQAYAPLNEAGVARLVQSLYNLPHYGQMLNDLAQVVASAYEANFRERPYRISHRKYWRGRDFQSQRSKPLVKKKRVISPGTAAKLGRTFMPGAGPSDSVTASDGIWEADIEFWPTVATTSTRTAPVRSIMDMNGEASMSEKGSGGGAGAGAGIGQQLANEFSAPPPYPGPGRTRMAPYNGQLANDPEPEKEVEKKGMWLRLKTKLRRK